MPSTFLFVRVVIVFVLVPSSEVCISMNLEPNRATKVFRNYSSDETVVDIKNPSIVDIPTAPLGNPFFCFVQFSRSQIPDHCSDCKAVLAAGGLSILASRTHRLTLRLTQALRSDAYSQSSSTRHGTLPQ